MIRGVHVARAVVAAIVAYAALALIARSIEAQPVRSGDATLAGTVLGDSSGVPLGTAVVTIDALHRSASAAVDGSFRMPGLPAGTHVVLIRSVGFTPRIDTVVLAAGETVSRKYLLEARATSLDTARTTAEARRFISGQLRDFEERRARGMGRFVGEETLRKNDDRPLSAVLQRFVPGLTMTRGVGGTTYAASSRKATPGRVFGGGGPTSAMTCYSTVYVDGIRIFDYSMMKTGAGPPDLGRMSAIEYAGIEYHASAATSPPWVSPTNADCGVLLLWTRER